MLLYYINFFWPHLFEKTCFQSRPITKPKPISILTYMSNKVVTFNRILNVANVYLGDFFKFIDYIFQPNLVFNADFFIRE